MLLSREYRVNLASGGAACDRRTANRWAGEPTTYALAAHVALRLTLEGRPDPATGYLADIRDIDGLLRSALAGYASADSAPSPAAVLEAVWSAASVIDQPPRPVEASCRASPHLGWSLHRDVHPMLRMTESFEFSASHRLHCPELSDEENRRIFGKCNNLRGHGHNYVVDVTIEGPADATTGLIVPPGLLERTVKAEVIDRFDHKHLNEDCPEFWHLNPSVENIARIVFGLLDASLPAGGAAARLASVRVWETPKTWAECREATDAIRPPERE